MNDDSLPYTQVSNTMIILLQYHTCYCAENGNVIVA